MKPISLLLISCLFLLFLCCSDDDSSDFNAVCNEPAPCTNVLLSFSVSVFDKMGDPVTLARFEVRDTKNNKNLTLKYSTERLRLMQKANSYYLLGGERVKEYAGKTTIIKFKGFKNSKEVVSGYFEVGADCCHVQLISGNTDLIVN